MTDNGIRDMIMVRCKKCFVCGARHSRILCEDCTSIDVLLTEIKARLPKDQTLLTHTANYDVGYNQALTDTHKALFGEEK